MLNEEEKSVDERVFAHHYVSCSPGLSDIFNTFNTNDDLVSINIDCLDSAPSSPKLKSILKKTPNKSQIICSPSSAAIRRSKSQVCRRSLSVRRELRFGPDTKKSPTISLISPKKHSRSFQLKRLFRCNSMSTAKEKVDNFITSTPINFLDDADDFGYLKSKKKWHSPMRNNLPLFYGAEKFQCGHCKMQWENNTDLMSHTNNHHKGVRHWLRPHYRCGICSVKFYKNKYLVRHCHLQHTPTTKRRL